MIYYTNMKESDFWDALFDSTRKIELTIEESDEIDPDVDEIDEDDYSDDWAV